MSTYKYKKITMTKSITIPDSVKQRLLGVSSILFGVLTAIVSEENGCYDITAAMFFVPIGLIIVFGKYK